MAKILLVEDDNNLSEIYQARLQAEGYAIVSAHDGEEALALAAKEKPDLIISDVMMPKISGFEMLDILRNTPELKSTKVIMLTALGQAEDKTRADALGADRYLVKSQVTLEDIVTAAKELVEGTSAAANPAAIPASQPQQAPPAATTPSTPTPPSVDIPVTAPPTPATPVESVTEPAPAIAVATPPAPNVPSVDTNTATPTQTTPAAITTPVPEAAPVEPPTTTLTPPTTQTVTPPVVEAAEPSTPPAPKPEPISPASPAAAPIAPLEEKPSVTEATSQPAATEAAAIQAQIENFVNSTDAQKSNVTPAPTEPAATASDQVNPVIDTPAVTPPPSSLPQSSSSNEDEKAVLSSAIDNLMANTKEQPATNAATETPAPVASSTPLLTRSTPDDQKKSGDNVTVAHKKIISPIADPNPKPSLDALLAAEEAQSPAAPVAPIIVSSTPAPAASAPVPAAFNAPAIDETPSGAPVHQPGNIVTPQTSGNSGFDPNSIAL